LAIVLQQHRLAGARRRDDEGALALADGAERSTMRVEMLSRMVFELEALVGIERREVVEEDLVAAASGGSKLIARP
jgi:hypothetical protein